MEDCAAWAVEEMRVGFEIFRRDEAGVLRDMASRPLRCVERWKRW
jgi:hypothetical protein